MLLKFAVTNYKSLKHQQVLDLTASTGDEFADSLYEIDDNFKVNSTACVIGPNGCGKTHLLKAIESLAEAIKSVEGVKIAHQPYVLDNESKKLPTAYEILIFNSELNSFINYSMAVIDGVVTHESLYVKANTKNAKTTKVFERDGEQISFAKKYNKQQQLLAGTLGGGGLIANYANSIKLAELSCVHLWGMLFHYIDPSEFSFSDVGQEVERFLCDVESIFNKNGLNENNQEDDSVLLELSNTVKSLGFPIQSISMIDTDGGKKKLAFELQTFDGQSKVLNYFEAQEYFSIGTFNAINILIFLCYFKLLSMNGSSWMIVIDEFDSSFHHKLSEAILSYIRQIKQDNPGTQVIMSTHDVLLLDKGFRRDSIFVLDKDEELSAVITRADDFSVRKDAKLSLKYLNNEFGALPKILSESFNG